MIDTPAPAAAPAPAPAAPAAPAPAAPAAPPAAAPAAPVPAPAAPAPAAPAPAAPVAKAPEKYELVIPEASKSRVSAATLTTLEAIARQNSWSNADAQAMLDEHLAINAAQLQHFGELAKADKDIGGDKLEHTQQLVKRAIDRVRPVGHPRHAAFTTLLNESGFANHPEVLAVLADFAKLMGEDRHVGGHLPSGGEKSVTSVLYDKTPASS